MIHFYSALHDVSLDRTRGAVASSTDVAVAAKVSLHLKQLYEEMHEVSEGTMFHAKCAQ